jgi:hypothetical protein
MAKYSKKIVDKICNLLKSDSYTIAEVCRLVGIAESTFFDWQANKVEFSECIKKPKTTGCNSLSLKPRSPY